MDFSKCKVNLLFYTLVFLCLSACDKQEKKPEIIETRAYFDTKISRPLEELTAYAKEMALKRPQLKLASEDPLVVEYYSKAKERVEQKDFRTAEIMYLGMATQGYADAQNNLVNFYAPSYWRPEELRNDKKSQYWRERVLSSGYAEAQYSYALSFYVGEFHNENWGKYAEWSYIAAEQGHARAQNTMGSLYLNGRGVEKDLIESYKWRTLAIVRYKLPEAGEEISKGSPLNITLWSRDLLISREGMTAEQVKEAKRRVVEWEKSHPYAYPPINKDTDILWKDIDLAGDVINKLEEKTLETPSELNN